MQGQHAERLDGPLTTYAFRVKVSGRRWNMPTNPYLGVSLITFPPGVQYTRFATDLHAPAPEPLELHLHPIKLQIPRVLRIFGFAASHGWGVVKAICQATQTHDVPLFESKRYIVLRLMTASCSGITSTE